MSAELIFTIFYLLISFGIVYPPEEFISAGFTIGNWFGKLLGSEDENFIRFHIKKSMLNLVVYSCLPIIYVALLYLLGFVDEISSLFIGPSISWQIFATFSIVAPLLALLEIHRWSNNNFQNHPIVRNLTKCCNNNTTWEVVAADVENEYRRLEIVTVKTNPMTKAVVTENWIIKVTLLNMFLAHQSDATVKLLEVNTFDLSHINANITQFCNIEVQSARVGSFIIRINALDFRNLKDKLSRRMQLVLPNSFSKSITEQFMEVFRETVNENPRYSTNMELDQCLGCLQARPGIKIQKQCPDEGIHPMEQKCTDCFCRPMWCLDCLTKWFVSRQDKDEQNRWLSKKCTCPMCRATFCVLDVCLLEQPQE
ncbi:E3 ubiquitin-protein ligase TM129 [Dendroctonus ponderosae]